MALELSSGEAGPPPASPSRRGRRGHAGCGMSAGPRRANALKQSCIFLRSRAARPITPDWYPRNIGPPNAISGQHHHPQSPEISGQKHHAAGVDGKSLTELLGDTAYLSCPVTAATKSGTTTQAMKTPTDRKHLRRYRRPSSVSKLELSSALAGFHIVPRLTPERVRRIALKPKTMLANQARTAANQAVAKPTSATPARTCDMCCTFPA